MDPNQLLLESRQKLAEGLLFLEDLEHELLRSGATADDLTLKEVHEVRAKLQEIRSRVDMLGAISGAAFEEQKLHQFWEPLAEGIHRTVERINQLHFKAKSSSREP